MIRNFIAILAAVFFSLGALAATDANQANRAELESVKGIGPGLSARILQARSAGAFKGWNDLVERVSGIGAGNAAKLSQAGLTVAGTAYDGPSAPAKAAKATKADKSAKRSKKAGRADT